MDYLFFTGGIEGYPGEIPFIALGSGAELPSLARIHDLGVKHFHCEPSFENFGGIEKNILLIYWQTELGFNVQAKLQADNPYLVEQYKKNPKFAELVISLLANYNEDKKTISSGNLLDDSDPSLFPELQEKLKQLGSWKAFLGDKLQNVFKTCRNIFQSTISNGYYVLPIMSNHLWIDVEPDVVFGRKISAPLEIDRQKFRFELVKDGVIWRLEKYKVMILLHFGYTDETTAAYYGFAEQLNQYRNAKQEERKKSTEAISRHSEDSSSRIKQERLTKIAILKEKLLK